MRNKKDDIQETVFVEIVSWSFVIGVIYIFARMTF